jgi:hypothetical protein
MVARGDLDGAQDEIKKFWATTAFNEVDPNDPFKKLNGLRQSLIAKAPLAMSEMNMIKYLSTLPQEKRSKFFQTQLKYMSLVDALAPSF